MQGLIEMQAWDLFEYLHGWLSNVVAFIWLIRERFDERDASGGCLSKSIRRWLDGHDDGGINLSPLVQGERGGTKVMGWQRLLTVRERYI